MENAPEPPKQMMEGDKIWLTSGGRTTKGHVTGISEDGLCASVSFDGVLCLGGVLFSTLALARGDDGGWREDGSGAAIDVAVIQ